MPNFISLCILRDASRRNTPPPGNPSGGVVYLRIVLFPEEASCLQVFFNTVVLQGGVFSTSPKSQAGGSPLVGLPRCLFNLFTATLHKGGSSSVRKLRTRHDVVTGTHYTWCGVTLDVINTKVSLPQLYFLSL